MKDVGSVSGFIFCFSHFNFSFFFFFGMWKSTCSVKETMFCSSFLMY